MITLITTVITPVCDLKNSNKAFHHYVENCQLWVSFLLKNQDQTKTKIGWFAFLRRK